MSFLVSSSPSIPSTLSSFQRQMSRSSDLSLEDQSNESRPILNKTDDDICLRSRSRSRSINTSLNWSSTEGGQSSCDTMSVALSEMNAEPPRSPEQHLVSRKAVLEKLGMTEQQNQMNRNNRSNEFNYPQWTMNSARAPRSQGHHSSSYSMDRLSVSSHESSGSGNYDSPRNVMQKPPSGNVIQRPPSAGAGRVGNASNPSLTPKTQRRLIMTNNVSSQSNRVLAATPCPCQHDSNGSGFQNYDIPRFLGKQVSIY